MTGTCPSNPDNQRCHSNRDNSVGILEPELLVDVCGCRHADECDQLVQGDRCVMGPTGVESGLPMV